MCHKLAPPGTHELTTLERDKGMDSPPRAIQLPKPSQIPEEMDAGPSIHLYSKKESALALVWGGGPISLLGAQPASSLMPRTAQPSPAQPRVHGEGRGAGSCRQGAG